MSNRHHHNLTTTMVSSFIPSILRLPLLLLLVRLIPTEGFHLATGIERAGYHPQFQQQEELAWKACFLKTTKSPSSATQLRAVKKDDDPADNHTNKRSIGSARFRGVAAVERANKSDDWTSQFDALLAWFNSDVASITLGVVGLIVVLIHRLFLPEINNNVDLLGEETRADLLAAVACGAVLVNGVSQLDVTSALAESVQLDGMLQSQVLYPNKSQQQNLRTNPDELEWALKSVLAATPTKTAVLLECLEPFNERDEKTKSRNSNSDYYYQWEIVAMLGIIPTNPLLHHAPTTTTLILDRLKRQADGSEAYLPTLPVLPGRFEFTYLPSNTQLVLLLPIHVVTETTTSASPRRRSFVLALGSNRSKSFTPRDIAWCQILAAKMGTILSENNSVSNKTSSQPSTKTSIAMRGQHDA
jgi:hypothetical protein